MAEKKKTKTRYLDINIDERGFVSKLIGAKKSYNFSDIKLLRNLLSNEKAKILYVLKKQKPVSIYALAKILGRDFKSVREDVKILERFGFIEFHAEKHGKRESLMPVLIIDKLEMIINI
ncbi:MAG: HTH domain-containing protein [Nanoarchaeota archaeon]|nr:HTH domain-containing protein [Nanoarchaeota archaeon]